MARLAPPFDGREGRPPSAGPSQKTQHRQSLADSPRDPRERAKERCPRAALSLRALEGSIPGTDPEADCTPSSWTGGWAQANEICDDDSANAPEFSHVHCLTAPGRKTPWGVHARWCGIRSGFNEGLEPPLEQAETAHWRGHLRQSGVSQLTIGRKSERAILHHSNLVVLSPLEIHQRNTTGTLIGLSALLWRDTENYEWIPKYEQLLKARAEEVIPAAFVILKRNGQPAVGTVRRQIRREVVVDLEALDFSEEALVSAMESTIREGGLTDAETRSFLNIWTPSFFAMESRRVICLMPRSYHDAVLKLEMHPRPSECVRVGFIWKELDKVAESQSR